MSTIAALSALAALATSAPARPKKSLDHLSDDELVALTRQHAMICSAVGLLPEQCSEEGHHLGWDEEGNRACTCGAQMEMM